MHVGQWGPLWILLKKLGLSIMIPPSLEAAAESWLLQLLLLPLQLSRSATLSLSFCVASVVPDLGMAYKGHCRAHAARLLALLPDSGLASQLRIVYAWSRHQRSDCAYAASHMALSQESILC